MARRLGRTRPQGRVSELEMAETSCWASIVLAFLEDWEREQEEFADDKTGSPVPDLAAPVSSDLSPVSSLEAGELTCLNTLFVKLPELEDLNGAKGLGD